jgi:Killing trait
MAEAKTTDKPADMEAGKATGKTPEASAANLGDFEDVMKLMLELSKNPATAPTAEAVANTLLTVIGSGPSFAAMQSLVAANQASGMMYHNAVANQQTTNILGMVATMNCVQALMDKPSVIPWPDLGPRREEAFE